MELAAADEATAGRLTTRGSQDDVLVEVRNLRKEYATGRGRLILFEGINFQVKRQQMLA
jgi:lipoprotein-releasing system ATP-binding protein